MAVLKEERDNLSKRMTRRVEFLLTYKNMEIDEVPTEYGWDSKRMKRLLDGKINFNLEDVIMLANTFVMPVEFFTKCY